jgi:hypothetical protein
MQVLVCRASLCSSPVQLDWSNQRPLWWFRIPNGFISLPHYLDSHIEVESDPLLPRKLMVFGRGNYLYSNSNWKFSGRWKTKFSYISYLLCLSFWSHYPRPQAALQPLGCAGQHRWNTTVNLSHVELHHVFIYNLPGTTFRDHWYCYITRCWFDPKFVTRRREAMKNREVVYISYAMVSESVEKQGVQEKG